MSEENAVSVDAEVKDVAPVENQVQDQVADEVKKDDAAPDPKPEDKQDDKRESRIQKRIDRLTREKYEAIAEAKALKMMIEQQQPRQEVSNKPTREQFADDSDFIEALTDYKIEQRDQNHNRTREQETQSQRAAEWNKRADVARQEYEDFDEVIEEAQDVPLHRSASKAILESDMATDIQYYLAKHPDEATKTVNMSPEGAARYIGRIEAQVAADKATRASQKAAIKKVSGAPAPVVPLKPVGGGNSPYDLNDGKLPVSDWMKKRNQELAARNGR